MDDENITSEETLADETELGSPDGKEAVESQTDTPWWKSLGKDFPDEATALKSVKDTYDYVGKAGKYDKAIKAFAESENISEEEALQALMENPQPEETQVEEKQTPEFDPEQYVTKAEAAEREFYAENQEMKPYKEIISALQAKNPDKSISEVVELDAFKDVYSKASAYDETEKSKSVLQSNPRLGAVTDKMAKARETLGVARKALQEGDVMTAQQASSDAADSAVGAVIDSYDLDK